MVGVSDNHILKMLRNEARYNGKVVDIPMIIPYHRSGINHLIASLRGIDFYNDYTNVQNTMNADGTKCKGKQPTFYKFLFDAEKNYLQSLTDENGNPLFTKSQINNMTHQQIKEVFEQYPNNRFDDNFVPRVASNMYIQWCKEHNLLSKFSDGGDSTKTDFSKEADYYKLLIDFSVYDSNGNYSKQGAVQMNFPKNFSEIVEESLKEHNVDEIKYNSKIASMTNDAIKVINNSKEKIKLIII